MIGKVLKILEMFYILIWVLGTWTCTYVLCKSWSSCTFANSALKKLVQAKQSKAINVFTKPITKSCNKYLQLLWTISEATRNIIIVKIWYICYWTNISAQLASRMRMILATIAWVPAVWRHCTYNLSSQYREGDITPLSRWGYGTKKIFSSCQRAHS